MYQLDNKFHNQLLHQLHNQIVWRLHKKIYDQLVHFYRKPYWQVEEPLSAHLWNQLKKDLK